MQSNYKNWLQEQKYDVGTISAQIHRVGRVEQFYGNLDKHYADGSLQAVIDALTYSTADERSSRPNPSKIPFDGNVRNNLQAYKNAVVRYRKFLTGWERSDVEAPKPEFVAAPSSNSLFEDASDEPKQKLSLERDMQAALRNNIRQLSSTLSIIDDGSERSVHSGFIDITCEDSADQSLVVIELKAGKADSRAIGQILGYMGDLAGEEDSRKVRGMLVAHEFDRRSKSAARVVPTLQLVRYRVDFRFEQEE